MKNIVIELSNINSVNFLWNDLIENLGFDKAKKIVSQACNLQRMHGRKNITMPIIFTGTCGLALISIESVKKSTTLNNLKGNQILIFNAKKKLFQILNETR